MVRSYNSLPPKLENHPMLVVHDCLVSIFAATFHICRLSVCNLRIFHVIVT